MKIEIRLTCEGIEIPALVQFDYYAPSPMHYIKSTGSFDPPDPAEIDVQKIWVKPSKHDKEWTEAGSWLAQVLQDDEGFLSQLIEAAENAKQSREDNSQFGVGA